MKKKPVGAFGADDDIVDYILGITFEIWEERGIELIHRYYGEAAPVYGLDGLVIGAAAVADGTRKALKSFPDRRLFADDVIWSGNRDDGYYSSHRVLSPMTNHGATMFGPATGRQVSTMNIADCVVEDGVITREWLMRDHYALVTQLGFNPIDAAARMAAGQSDAHRDWLGAELARVNTHAVPEYGAFLASAADDPALFAPQLLLCLWSTGRREVVEQFYAPYAVLHRSKTDVHSGRAALASHYRQLRDGLTLTGLTIDHLAVQPWGSNGRHIAVRWALAATHSGPYLGLAASGKPVFVLGASHWRVVGDRIATEWTVFDGVGVLSQLV